MEKTIKAAIKKVLLSTNKPMTISEVASEIKRLGLYQFKTDNPASIISTEIRRHCMDSPQLKGRSAEFVQVEGRKYSLA